MSRGGGQSGGIGLMLEKGWYEFGLLWCGFLQSLRPLGCFLLVYFGVVLVVVVVVVLTGIKQSQLLVPKLMSGL